MKYILLIMILMSNGLSNADELKKSVSTSGINSTTELNKELAQQETINKKQTNTLLLKDSITDSLKSPKSCYQITDTFCNQLWDKEHNGHIKVMDGEIHIGKSNKSKIDTASIMDKLALVNSQPRLPKDLKDKATPLIEKLKTILATESESKKWFRELEDFENKWVRLLRDVSEKRVHLQYPEIKKKKLHDLDAEDNYLLAQENYKIIDEVTDAKYIQSSQWIKIQGVFKIVQNDILTAIQQLNYSEELKSKWMHAISETQLSLPYLDPDKLQTQYNCATHAINASYNSRYKKITVCAGFFNTLQSESASYFILAHELAHSIDPSTLGHEYLVELGLRNKNFKQIIGNKDKVLECNQWNKIIEQTPQISIPKKLISYEYDNLMQCLDDKKPLKKEYDSNEITKISERSNLREMDHYANLNSFVLMLQPNYNEEGFYKKNKRFLRTDLILSHAQSSTPVSLIGRNFAEVPEIFFQSLFCQKDREFKNKDDLIQFINNGSPTEKNQLFKLALKQTAQIMGWLIDEEFVYCGQYCHNLVSYGMARNVSEKFADWLAFHTLHLFLERKNNLIERQEASAASTALFCDPPSPQREAQDYIALEKEYSLEAHPEQRARRYSIYNTENSQLLQCNTNQNIESWGNCKSK